MSETKGLMTEGVIWKKILWFSVPLLLGNVFQQLYNTVDSVIVGNYIGGGALAAVGTSGPVINLLVGLFAGISTGAGVVIARYFGARDDKGVHDSVHTTLAATFIGGIFLAILGVALSPTVLRLIGVPADILQDSIIYLRIYFGGVVAMMTYNMGAGILRAVGASKGDVRRVFIAETVIEGLAAGLVGVGVTELLLVPVNLLVQNVFELNAEAVLSSGAAVILVAISAFLTFIAGLIPANSAAKKDPVVALRTE